MTDDTRASAGLRVPRLPGLSGAHAQRADLGSLAETVDGAIEVSGARHRDVDGHAAHTLVGRIGVAVVDDDLMNPPVDLPGIG